MSKYAHLSVARRHQLAAVKLEELMARVLLLELEVAAFERHVLGRAR